LAGEEINLLATANTGFEFVNWTDQQNVVVSTDAAFIFTMPAEDITLTANFSEESTSYVLTLEVSPSGSGTVEGGGEYMAGEEVTISATANAGFEFVNWTDQQDAEVSTDADFVYNMPAEDFTLTANFILHGNYIIPGEGVTDIEGNDYATIIIGDQEWMASNLHTTKYNDGTSITTGLEGSAWGETEEGAYAVYPYDGVDGIDSEAEMIDSYGVLYNWYAVDHSSGLCPEGWHVPTDEEWISLTNYLMNDYVGIDENNYGNALKSCRQVDSPLGGDCDTEEHPRWNFHGTHYGTDVFGLSLLPAGIRTTSGGYVAIGNGGHWYTSTEDSEENALRRTIFASGGSFSSPSGSKRFGISVRCIKD
jgi:uncharacterized protein (TIGR02145 family)/uncharacterized repeat protein (TIGR02543 family)